VGASIAAPGRDVNPRWAEEQRREEWAMTAGGRARRTRPAGGAGKQWLALGALAVLLGVLPALAALGRDGDLRRPAGQAWAGQAWAEWRLRWALGRQLDAYAAWERRHPHECLEPLLTPAGEDRNEGYILRVDRFVADYPALARYRAWFRATYAREHPPGTRFDRYLADCAPAAVLREARWLDRYVAR
jgi:hypothetical protein